MNAEHKSKLLKIIREKVASFPNNPRGFRELENYFKSHNVAVWGFYRGYKKYSRRKWRPVVDVPATGDCILQHGDDRYYLPTDLAEKALILGGLP